MLDDEDRDWGEDEVAEDMQDDEDVAGRLFVTFQMFPISHILMLQKLGLDTNPFLQIFCYLFLPRTERVTLHCLFLVLLKQARERAWKSLLMEM